MRGFHSLTYEKYKKQTEAHSPGKGPGVSKELTTFIGISELAGAVGLILPLATHTAPVLTPLAALGLAIIMCLAIAFHMRRHEPATPAVVLLALAVLVTIGRALDFN